MTASTPSIALLSAIENMSNNEQTSVQTPEPIGPHDEEAKKLSFMQEFDQRAGPHPSNSVIGIGGLPFVSIAAGVAAAAAAFCGQPGAAGVLTGVSLTSTGASEVRHPTIGPFLKTVRHRLGGTTSDLESGAAEEAYSERSTGSA